MATIDASTSQTHYQSKLLTHPNTGLPLRFAFHRSITPGMQPFLGEQIAANGGVVILFSSEDESVEDVNVLLVSRTRLGVPIQFLRTRYEGEGVFVEGMNWVKKCIRDGKCELGNRSRRVNSVYS